MSQRCKAKTGSFGAHFDELVKHFPRELAKRNSPRDNADLQEKRDIHALLFERAWVLDGRSEDGR